MLAKLLCTKRKSASAPRCLRCLGATIDIVNSITRTANRSGQGGIFASMFTKGQHRGHGDHWAWRLAGNYCIHIDIQEGAAWCAQSLLVGQDMNPGVPESPLHIGLELLGGEACLCNLGAYGFNENPHALYFP